MIILCECLKWFGCIRVSWLVSVFLFIIWVGESWFRVRKICCVIMLLFYWLMLVMMFDSGSECVLCSRCVLGGVGLVCIWLVSVLLLVCYRFFRVWVV